MRQRNWDAIRAAIEAGDKMPAVAKRFAVPVGSIKTRSQKEQWASPNRVGRQLNELAKAGVIEKPSLPAKTAANNATNSQLQQSDDSSTELPAESSGVAVDPREGYAAAVAYHIAKKVQRALPNMPDPRSWRDLNTADSMARRAMGLDKQVVRAAGIFGGTGSQTGFALEITSNDSLDTTADNAENGWFDSQES